MNELIVAFWLMLPAYLPNNCAALFGGGLPLDMGLSLQDGKRIMGDGKTFRGTIAGTICGVLFGLFLNLLAPSIGLPAFGQGWGQIPVLFGLSMGAMLGDMAAAFFKRRLGLGRGAPLAVIDQLDFVVGSWLLTLALVPAWFWQNFTLTIILIVLIITPILHRMVNILGYRMGAKREPW
jgi:CDP-2,3-bis-(O-geranylgeranyl)-sn-glycerol synthase